MQQLGGGMYSDIRSFERGEKLRTHVFKLRIPHKIGGHARKEFHCRDSSLRVIIVLSSFWRVNLFPRH